MSARIPGDQARVTVFVEVEPAAAFEVFTQEVDLWWRRGPKYRMGGRHPGTLAFEPRVGGRLFESVELPSGTRAIEIGRVTVWEPPARLVFEWRASNFARDEKTEVEVLFQPIGDGTQVTVCHRGWAKIRPDHPVRHGQDLAGTMREMGMWWGSLMTALREYVESR